MDEDNNNYNNELQIDEWYGDKDLTFEISDMDAFYSFKKSWTPMTLLQTNNPCEAEAKEAEAMYYSGYHGARRKRCGCGGGKWVMYDSKCGYSPDSERLEHVWNQLNDSSYGYPVRAYK